MLILAMLDVGICGKILLLNVGEKETRSTITSLYN